MSNYNTMNGFHGPFYICMHPNIGHLLSFSLLDLMPYSPGKHPFFYPIFDNMPFLTRDSNIFENLAPWINFLG